MKEIEENIIDAGERKRRIRERYKGIDPNELDFIPAREKENIHKSDVQLRVAVYARVSTDDPNQTSSYELQKNHYNDFVNNHPKWTLVKIYADEGISGTSLQHRDSFMEMIKDCEQGRIDMIVTKSVSRFARNIVDCIKIERDLKKLAPPVGVFFETEHIYTLDEDSEVMLSIMAMMAQEESHTKSEIMNASIEMRFRRGIFLTPTLLGYDQDKNGNLVINEDEAKIVRLIFYMYLYGYTCQQIADTLTTFGQSTKKGNTEWSASSILQILQNERHCGDVLARKTWTPSFLDHKSKKNNQDRNQYRHKDHHEAIISRDDFIAVQRLISNAKYGNKGFLPELRVIPDGVLKGYIPVNPRWAGFKADDYYAASNSVDSSSPTPPNPDEITAQTGDFDLRGYEVARAQFFDTADKISVTFSASDIKFNTAAVRKFDKNIYIEMLIHPKKRSIAVRSCTKDNRNHMQWSRSHDASFLPRPISGNAFLPTIYKVFGWNINCKYRILGQLREKNGESVLLFDVSDTEVFIPTEALETQNDDMPMTPFMGSKKSVLAYPETWADTFGNNYYKQAQAEEFSRFPDNVKWHTDMAGKPYKEPDLKPTGIDELRQHINSIMDNMKQETQHE